MSDSQPAFPVTDSSGWRVASASALVLTSCWYRRFRAVLSAACHERAVPVIAAITSLKQWPATRPVSSRPARTWVLNVSETRPKRRAHIKSSPCIWSVPSSALHRASATLNARSWLAATSSDAISIAMKSSVAMMTSAIACCSLARLACLRCSAICSAAMLRCSAICCCNCARCSLRATRLLCRCKSICSPARRSCLAAASPASSRWCRLERTKTLAATHAATAAETTAPKTPDHSKNHSGLSIPHNMSLSLRERTLRRTRSSPSWNPPPCHWSSTSRGPPPHSSPKGGRHRQTPPPHPPYQRRDGSQFHSPPAAPPLRPPWRNDEGDGRRQPCAWNETLPEQHGSYARSGA